MQVTQVDERTTGWEDDHPVFRVYLHGSDEASTYGWTDTYDITGADVLQVIDWAQRQAGDVLTYAVALVSADADRERLNPGYGRGLDWLVGIDGNDSTDEGSRRVGRRSEMLERRRHSVAIPQADQAPANAPHPYEAGGRAHR